MYRCKSFEMEQLVIDMRVFMESNKYDRVVEKIAEIVERISDFVMLNCAYFDVLLLHNDDRIVQIAADAIAEICKNPKNKPAFTVDTVINPLVAMLSSDDKDVVMQSMRAIGNICFDNNEARKLVGKLGLKSLLSVLKKHFMNNEFDAEVFHVGCCAIMNLVMVDDEMLLACIELKVIEVFEYIILHNLSMFEATENNTNHMVYVLAMMSEHLQYLPLSTIEMLVNVLKFSRNPDISCICLEVLKMQSESDDIKLCLAHIGTCEMVYELVERYGPDVDDKSSRSALQMACDLIVLILTGDDSMVLLYEDGKGQVFEQMMRWLDSKDVDLLSTAILSVGNFARSDKNCIQLVKNGLGKKLLRILKNYSNDEDTKVQYGLLSTLRNLSIPSENKLKLLDENLVNILLSLSNIDKHEVQLKLLITLRMVVDGQEKTAAELIKRTDFIGKLVGWCQSENLEVKAEAPRLLAWLIKNCRSPRYYPSLLLVPESVRCLVEMMCSMHSVIQNEALLALNLLSASCLTAVTSLDVLLMDAEVCTNISSMLMKYGPILKEETVCNIMTFLEFMALNKMLRRDIIQSDVLDSLCKLLLCNDNLENISDRITNYIEQYHPFSNNFR